MNILKKIFFASLFIFFISLLFWGIYTISFKKAFFNDSADNKILSSDPNLNINTKSPEVVNAKIAPVSEEPVISPVLSLDENNILYYSTSGELKETDLIGSTTKKISDKKITSLLSATWSPDKSKALLKTNAKGYEYFLLFDAQSQKITTLNNNINATTWLGTSDKIIYKYFDPAKRKSSLNISDPNGENWKKIADLPHDKISFFQVPRSGLVSFWNNGDAYYPTALQSISLLGENLKSLYQSGFGADYLWDSIGSHALVSQTDAKGGTKMQLGIINYNGGEYKNLGLPTFVSKCAWSKDNKTIYCALPGNIPDNAILPNDYKTEKFKTSDTFWKINTETGEKERIVKTDDIAEAYDVSRPFLNSDESLLFFVNKNNGKLYKISL